MRKSWLIIASLASVVALSAMLGCTAPEPGESNFNLIFRYGIGANNELNTFDGTYTKDMILDPSITVNLSLSEEELESIYQKMVEIDFFGYPDEFSVSVPPGETAWTRTPHSSYYFKVEHESKIKELWWKDEIRNNDEKADKLRGLTKLISDIIESKEEYKELPPPRGGYI
jgi:hypothetical protein